jgi:hypothetical protein
VTRNKYKKNLQGTEEEKNEEVDGENMVDIQKADERSLCPYTNLRLLYWSGINHRSQ